MAKKESLEAAPIYERFVNKKTNFSTGSKKQSGTRLEITVLSAIPAALNGDIAAAELVLYMHAYSRKYGDFKAETIAVKETETQKDIRLAREKAKADRTAKRIQNAQTKDRKLAKSKGKRGSITRKNGRA